VRTARQRPSIIARSPYSRCGDKQAVDVSRQSNVAIMSVNRRV
jgi:hypothetical protein